MAIQSRYYFDRVYETTNASGTGDLTLNGAVTGYLSFADGVHYPDGVEEADRRFTYVIEAVDVRGTPTGLFEIGRGYADISEDGVTTLVRESVILNSKNTTNRIDFEDDLKNVYIDVSADDLNYLIKGVADNADLIGSWKDEAVTSAANAKASEANAKTSETNAKASETNARASEEAAKTSEANAASSASKAAASEAAAKASETNAADSASKAATSETNAKASEENAKISEENAKTSETNTDSYLTQAIAAKEAAATSEANAKTSETNAKASETNAASSATSASGSASAASASAANAKASEENAKAYEADAKKYADAVNPDLLQPKLVFDATPTSGSSNPVTSDGIKKAIDAKDALPSQTGNSGKFLTTDGTDPSWVIVDNNEDFSASITEMLGEGIESIDGTKF